MNICISWATWFLWQWLAFKLLKEWHVISVLSRSYSKAFKLFWENIKVILRDTITKNHLEWVDIVIHLAWAPLFRFPWSNLYKKMIYDSRILTTKKLVALLPSSCHTFICGSAIGYYPSSLTSVYDELHINISPKSFLEKVCVDWEEQASKAKSERRRVIYLRTWIVEWNQWMKKKIVTTTKWVGWVVLWWDQYLSLLSSSSWHNKVIECIHNKKLQWPINLVDYTISMDKCISSIARNLNRPVRLTIPNYIVKMILWPMSQIILDSHKVTSKYFSR